MFAVFIKNYVFYEYIYICVNGKNYTANGRATALVAPNAKQEEKLQVKVKVRYRMLV